MSSRSAIARIRPTELPPVVTARNTSLWRRDHHLADVAALLPHIRLLSLDVFDTLLFRACRQPEDVFLEVGRRAERLGLLSRGLSAGEFAALRHAAQATGTPRSAANRVSRTFTPVSPRLSAPSALCSAWKRPWSST